MKFADREELFNLELPDIDRGFNISFNKPQKKVLLKENNGIEAYAYASYIDITFMTGMVWLLVMVLLILHIQLKMV